MADTNAKINDIAENALLRLAARVCMVLVLPFGGFIGAGVWAKVDKTNESSIRQEETLRNIVTYQIPSMAGAFDNRFNAQANRIDEHGRRIGKLEDWRNERSTVGRP